MDAAQWYCNVSARKVRSEKCEKKQMADLPNLPQTEAAIVAETNAFRKTEGLGTLTRNPALEQAARAFAKYLAKSGKFAHEADGRQPADRAKAAGYEYCTVAENLALNLDSRGFTAKRLATEAMDGWKKSPGHRHNLLLAGVTEIGVAIAQAPGADPKFLSVQLFGRPRSLAFDFTVVNRSHDTVSYTFSGKTFDIKPRVTNTHTTCEAGKVAFTRSGNWLTGHKMKAAYHARSGAKFVLRPGPQGNVHVQLEN